MDQTGSESSVDKRPPSGVKKPVVSGSKQKTKASTGRPKQARRSASGLGVEEPDEVDNAFLIGEFESSEVREAEIKYKT